jgi:hypothetical protein
MILYVRVLKKLCNYPGVSTEIQLLEGGQFRFFCFDHELLKVKIILRPMVSRPVCLEIEHPSGAHDQIFITV